MAKMGMLLLAALLVITLAACAKSTPKHTPRPRKPTATPTAAATATPTSTPTPTPSPTPTSTPIPTLTPTPTLVPELALDIYFLDVHQGDAILIVVNGDHEMLIDGGASKTRLRDRLQRIGLQDLDVIVATHPHADHIAGLGDALEMYEVERVYMNGEDRDTSTYRGLVAAIEAEGVQYQVPRRGDTIALGPLTFNVLHPASLGDSSNDNSIVLHLGCGALDVLFTGDAEVPTEGEMLVQSVVPVPDVDVLKVGHHGSRTATSEAFLAMTQPEYGIISAGRTNTYGHPHQEALDRLQAAGVALLYTDTTEADDTILLVSDCQTYSFATPPGPATPTPTLTSTDTPTVTPTQSPTPTPTSTPTPTPQVAIASVDLQAEVATIVNLGDTPVNLEGWRLVSVVGDQEFIFPTLILQPGDTVEVTSGKNAVDSPPHKLKWTTAYIWSNEGDPATLYDDQGTLVSQYPAQ